MWSSERVSPINVSTSIVSFAGHLSVICLFPGLLGVNISPIGPLTTFMTVSMHLAERERESDGRERHTEELARVSGTRPSVVADC